MMEQWRQNRIVYLTENVNDLVRNGENNIRKMKAQQAADIVSTKKRTIHELELRMKAEGLANAFKEKSLSEEDLIRIFNKTYANWVSTLEHTNPIEKRSIEEDIEKILFELFQADSRLIRDEMKRKEHTLYEKMDMLENSISIDELKDSYISISQAWFKRMFKVKKEQCKQHAVGIINIILGKIDNFLGSVMFEDSPFEKPHVKEVFMIIIDSINKHNAGIDETQSFTFTAALRVKMAVHVAKYITVVFTIMDKRYDANHNVMAQIGNYKISTWEYFKDIYKNKKDEVTTANLLFRKVEKIVKSEIENNLPRMIVKTIIEEHFPTKHSLMVAVMTDLANEDDFNGYLWYITDAENFVLKWITKFTNDSIFKADQKSKYMLIVAYVIEKYLKRIRYCLEFATMISMESNSDVYKWVKVFETSLAEHIPVPIGTFSVPDNLKFVDFTNLNKCFLDQLNDMQDSLLSEFHNDSKTVFFWKGRESL
ncbi:unnamed protein product [Mytilus edulis]|uniref:Uncharacterized protein n=1 Tax=Mytilus edulis TaxID=6550 RepID=A0A8S3QKP9_MYTED|nr:unnamed protein product [Mytilus edulis]